MAGTCRSQQKKSPPDTKYQRLAELDAKEGGVLLLMESRRSRRYPNIAMGSQTKIDIAIMKLGRDGLGFVFWVG